MGTPKEQTWPMGATLAVLLGAVGMLGLSCARSDSGEHGDHEHHGASQPSADEKPSGRLQDGVRVVKITAGQFQFVPDRIVVVQGEKVRLEAVSSDVTHGIMVREMDIDRKLEPGKTELIEFTPDKPGDYHFHCSVYCGDGHDRMHGEIVVLPAGETTN